MTGFIRPGDTGVAYDRDGGEEVAYDGTGGNDVPLPVDRHGGEILYALEVGRVVVVIGETGSGKSTRVPKIAVAGGWGKIAVAVPGGVAAVSLGKRGGTGVGYRARLYAKEPHTADILYTTTDLLTQQISTSPLLSEYSIIMVDEAHLRTASTDLLLAMLKKIMKKRGDLRVVVASATMDPTVYLDFFKNFEPNIVNVQGSAFPVDVYYVKTAVGDYVKSAVQTVTDIHKNKAKGDVLVFLPTHEDVSHAAEISRSVVEGLGKDRLRAVILTIHNGMPIHEQLKVFKPETSRDRKIIFSTSVTETSLTIPGVVYVVDTGFAEKKIWDHESCVTRCATVKITQSTAEQRTGRAGRILPGACYRLYTEDAFNKMERHELPGILTTDLTKAVLTLKTVNVRNVVKFPYLSRPSVMAVQRAVENLYSLRLLNDDCDIVQPNAARFMASPGDVATTAFVMHCDAMGVGEAGVKISAMLSIKDLWLRGRRAEETRGQYHVKEGDLASLLNVFTGFEAAQRDVGWAGERGLNYKALLRAVELRKGFAKLDASAWEVTCPDLLEDKDTAQSLTIAAMSSWPTNIAHRTPTGYRTLRSPTPLQIHPLSSLHTIQPDWILYTHCIETPKALYAVNCVTIDNPLWLVKVVPGIYDYQKEPQRREELKQQQHQQPDREAGKKRKSTWLDIDLF